MADSQTLTKTLLPCGPTAHVDTFCRDSLPPPELMPHMDYSVLPALAYPDRLNAAVELLDRRIAEGDGELIEELLCRLVGGLGEPFLERGPFAWGVHGSAIKGHCKAR